MEDMTMRMTVRTQILALAMLALTASVPNSVKAQSRLDVPFNFVVAGKTLPAGTYSITQNKAIGLVSLQGEGQTISWMADSNGSALPATTGSLTFDRIGGAYYLRAMQYGRMMTPRLDSHVRVSNAGPSVAVEGQ
jgi:hypothetical protein